MRTFFLFCGLMALAAGRAAAQQVSLFEGFETYQRDSAGVSNILDANYSGGLNKGTNGGPGNPWWGQFPPDLRVVGTDTNIVPGIITNVVSPHSGTNMVRGRQTGQPDFDRNFYNLAWRLNHSANYHGNLTLDWWFFDPVGANTNAVAAPKYQDYVSLGCWSGVPTDTDFVTNISPGVLTAQLSLGAADSQASGYQSTNYQAQILHTTGAGAYDTNNGWFNLPVARSVGWHHAKILLAPALNNGTAAATFYVDNLTNALLTANDAAASGFNCLTLQAEYSTGTTGYFDDLTFIAPLLPSLNIALAGSNAIVTWSFTNWTLQTTANPALTNFADVAGATSPFTNSLSGGTKYFRLRQ
jgi:hypothetical protein